MRTRGSLSPLRPYSIQQSIAALTDRLLGRHISRKRNLASTREEAHLRDNYRRFQTPQRSQIRGSDSRDWDQLPVARLKQFGPRKEVELDDCNGHAAATAYLLQQHAKAETLQQIAAAKKREVREKMREGLVQRHREIEALERRTGIVKLRLGASPAAQVSFDGSNSSSFLCPFGLTKTYSQSPRLRQISQPRGLYKPKSPLLYADFRGLLHKENSEAMKRLRTSLRCSSPLRRKELEPVTPAFQ